MGVGVVAREPRELGVADGRALSARRTRARTARLGLAASVGAVAFLIAYAVLQLLHVADRDPAVVAALSPIPLYARFVAGVAVAAPVGAASGLLAGDPARALRGVPTILAAAIALFVAVAVLFP
jgi:hypothetical protein